MSDNVYLKFLTEKYQNQTDFENSDKAKKLFINQRHFTVSLFDAMREGCLVLDKELIVKAVNDSFCELFKVKKADTDGKLLYDLGNGEWDIPELRTLLEELLPEKKEIDSYKVEHQFEKIGKRVMLLNARMINHLQLILITIEDITARTHAIDKLNDANENLQDKVQERTIQVHKLASRLNRSELMERRRISALLHDDLQQLLVAIKMNLNVVVNKMSNNSLGEEITDEIQGGLSLLDDAINTTRELTSELDPAILKSEQLTDILEWLKNRFENMYNFTTKLEIYDNFQIKNEELRADILQVLRESLFNTVKHGEVNNAKIVVAKSKDNYLEIQVSDKGKGFELEEKKLSYGLTNIRDRIQLHNGDLNIKTAPGEGTQLNIRLPIKQERISLTG